MTIHKGVARAVLAAVAAATLSAPLLIIAPASAESAFASLTAAELVAHDFTLYFANSGAQMTDSVAAGDHMGLYQTLCDQPYGTDTKTGARWGYVVDDTSNPIANASTGNDKLVSLRYDEEPAGANLASRAVKYDFDLPNGTYDITFGFELPSGWGSRDVVLAAEGRSLETITTGTALVEKTYSVDVADGTLNLAVQSPSGRTSELADPAVNYLLVKAQPTWGTDVLQAKIDQSALTEAQAAHYAPATVSALSDAAAAGQSLIDAGSTDATAIKGAYDQITAAHQALRALVTYDSFRPGQPWVDDQGLPIQAHGGQVVTSKEKNGKTIYYWYGEDRSNGYYSSPGVHVYSSYDLYNWTDKGLALRAMSSPDQFTTDPYFGALYGSYTAEQKAAVYRDLGTVQTDPAVNPAVLERPKVIYNAKDHQWVMWVHADGPSPGSNAQYAKAKAGVAVSNSPCGPFRYIDSYRLDVAPAGEPNYQPDSPGMARDMNLFVDDDGAAYIIYSSEENYSLFISKLNDDYTGLSASPETAVKGADFTRPYIGAHREAPAMFKFDGTYYLITSGATGWAPNPATYATATSILGEWTDHGNPISGPGAADAFTSQSTSVIPIDAAAGKFIYMGDRWTPDDLVHSPYVWLPMTFGEGGSLKILGPTEWTLGDLTPTTRFTVSANLPEHVWLGDTSTLPTTVKVASAGTTTTTAVTWDTSALSQPGVAPLQGTLPDGRTFSRSILAVPHGLKYVVNAGGAATADWSKITDIANSDGGLLNSVPEQPYGSDPSHTTTWGYQVSASGTYGGAGDDIYSSLRYAKDKSDLTYKFDNLTSGKYVVYAGYFDPWPQANRAARVTINGTVVEETRTFTGENTSGTYAGVEVGSDGKITFTLTPTRSPDIQVSWVMVARPKAAQSITFGGLGDRASDDADFTAGATASSGLAVSYQASGVCTLNGGTVHLTGAGTCTITASQTGSDDFTPAADVKRTFTVHPPVLDNFNRADGSVGGNWSGASSPPFYRIANNQLDIGIGGPLVYKTSFGTTQEASVTLATIDSKSPFQGVLLKVQSGSGPEAGALAVVYDATAKAVRVSSLRVGARSWTPYAKKTATFAAGDVLTARASATGEVQVYRNGESITTVTLGAADQAFFNQKGGQIGIWALITSHTVLDDFRGGTISN